MDIKSTAISAKFVIESLVALLENENVDISSIKFKVGSTSEGYESPDMEFGKLIDLALSWLEEAKAQAVPEGFVLAERKRLADAVDGIEKLFKEDNLLALGELLPIQQDLNAMIETQEPDND